MKNTLKVLFAASALLLANVASAVMISGEVAIGLTSGSSVVLNKTANTVTFTAGPKGDGRVNFSTGAFAGLDDAYANYNNFSYDPFSSPLVLWNMIATPTTYFTLMSIDSISETVTGVTLSGSGMASILGYEDTFGTWAFSSDKAGSRYSFSSTTSVPDSGSSLLLLGLGLTVVGGVARLRRK